MKCAPARSECSIHPADNAPASRCGRRSRSLRRSRRQFGAVQRLLAIGSDITIREELAQSKSEFRLQKVVRRVSPRVLAAPVVALHLMSGADQRFSTWNHRSSAETVVGFLRTQVDQPCARVRRGLRPGQ